MRRVLKYAFPLLLLIIIAAGWWSYEILNPPTKGTAATFAELKKYITLPEYWEDLPEVGPFHWERPSDEYFTIRGKAKDPRLIFKWVGLEMTSWKLE